MERPSSSNNPTRNVHSASTSTRANMGENDASYLNQNSRDNPPLGREPLYLHSEPHSSASKAASSNCKGPASKRLKPNNNNSTTAPIQVDIQSHCDSDDRFRPCVRVGERFLHTFYVHLFPQQSQLEQVSVASPGHRSAQTNTETRQHEPHNRSSFDDESNNTITLVSDDDDDEQQEEPETWTCHLSSSCSRVFANRNSIYTHAFTDHTNVEISAIFSITAPANSSEKPKIILIKRIWHSALSQQQQQSSANSNDDDDHRRSSASGALRFIIYPVKGIIFDSPRELSCSDVRRELIRLAESIYRMPIDGPSTFTVILDSESTGPIELAQVGVPNRETQSLSNYRPQSSGSLIQRPPTTITSSTNPFDLAQVGVPNRETQSLSGYRQQSRSNSIQRPPTTITSATIPNQQARVPVPKPKVHSHDSNHHQSTVSASEHSLVATTNQQLKLSNVPFRPWQDVPTTSQEPQSNWLDQANCSRAATTSSSDNAHLPRTNPSHHHHHHHHHQMSPSNVSAAQDVPHALSNLEVPNRASGRTQSNLQQQQQSGSNANARFASNQIINISARMQNAGRSQAYQQQHMFNANRELERIGINDPPFQYGDSSPLSRILQLTSTSNLEQRFDHSRLGAPPTRVVMNSQPNYRQMCDFNMPSASNHPMSSSMNSSSSHHPLATSTTASLAHCSVRPFGHSRFSALPNRVVMNSHAGQMYSLNWPNASNQMSSMHSNARPVTTSESEANVYNNPIDLSISRVNLATQAAFNGIVNQPRESSIEPIRANRDTNRSIQPNIQTTTQPQQQPQQQPQPQSQPPTDNRVSVIVALRQAIANRNQNNPLNVVAPAQPQPVPTNMPIVVGIKCNLCNPSTTHLYESKGDLKTHKKLVHGVEKFECLVDDCSKSFTKKEEFSVHLKRAHGEVERLPCKLCPQTSLTYSTLTHHYANLHSHTRYKCPHCAFSSFKKSNVVRHIKYSHENPGSDPYEYHCTDGTKPHTNNYCLRCYEKGLLLAERNADYELH